MTIQGRRTAPGRMVLRLAHVMANGAAAARRRARRRRLLLGLRMRAGWVGARVDCDIAPSVRLGRRLHVVVAPRTSNVVRIGARTKVGDDVRIELRGGELLIGADVDLRHHCVLGVGGRIDIAGRNVLQHGCTFHCDESITLARLASLGEYTTVIDSSHLMDGPSEWFVDDVRSAPVVIGESTWVGAKATIGRGVRLGDGVVLGANSVAAKDVPAGHLASGVPARVVRPVGSAARRPSGSNSNEESRRYGASGRQPATSSTSS